MSPVVVVGTGRSGTSTVARLMQERLKVRMVRVPFLRPDKWNPLGYYEDREMKALVKKLNAGKITPGMFAAQAREHMTDGQDVPWGFKVPQTCFSTSKVLDALGSPKIIACLRDRVSTGESIAGWRRSSWKLNAESGQRKADERMAGLLKFLHGREVLWLDFSEPRDETKLTGHISRFLGMRILSMPIEEALA